MYKKDDDDDKNQAPPLLNMNNRIMTNRGISTMIVAILVLTTSAIMVQTEETRESPGMNGSSMMRVQRSAPLMMAKSEMANEEEEEGDEMIISAGSSTMGREVLKALDKAESDIPDDTPIEKMLVHRGNLSLQAHKARLESQMTRVKALVTKENRGYIESESFNNIVYGKRDKRQVMDVQFRVKSQYFHETMAAIQELVGQDMVASVHVSSQDVTDSYIDSSARADTLDASRKALKILLEKATNVKEIMDIQRELNALTQQYESHRKRAVHLKKEATFSYLSVHCEEEVPTSDDGKDSGWQPSKAFLLAWNHMQSSIIMIGDTIIYSLVWVVPLCVVFLIVSSLCVKRAPCE